MAARPPKVLWCQVSQDRTSMLTHGSTQRQANFLPKEPSLLESKKRYTLPPDPSNTRIQGAYADIWQQSARPVRHPGRSQSSLEFTGASSLASHLEASQTRQQRVTTAEHHRQVTLLCSCHCQVSPAFWVQFAQCPTCPTSCCHVCNNGWRQKVVCKNGSGCRIQWVRPHSSYVVRTQLLLQSIVACCCLSFC